MDAPTKTSVPFEEQGCASCREQILSALSTPLIEIEHIGGGHFIYQCTDCKAFWEVGLREAHQISEEEERLLREQK